MRLEIGVDKGKNMEMSDGINSIEVVSETVNPVYASNPVTVNISGDTSAVHGFSLAIDLLDNTEHTYTVSVVGVRQSANHTIYFNSPNAGLTAVLTSWQNDIVNVTVRNNTGQRVTQNLTFKIK